MNHNTSSDSTHQWVQKNGYNTCLLASDIELNEPGTQAQLVQFTTGKYSHYHKETTEFFYFTRGNGRVLMNDAEVLLTAGSTLLIQPNTPHAFINDSIEPLEAIMFKTNSKADDTFTV